LSAVVQKWDEFAIILVMLLVNAGLGFFQEHRALSALAALKASFAEIVVALRDGAFATVMARDLVDGDIGKPKIGDIVPADVKLVDGDYLSVDQAALTGVPVSSARALLALNADLFRFDLDLVRDGEECLLAGSRWQRADVRALLPPPD
jgi:H+-transporting ATPase